MRAGPVPGPSEAPRYPKRASRGTSTEPQPQQDGDDLLFCDDCQKDWDGDCPYHGPLLVIADTEVPFGHPERALLTAPNQLAVELSKVPGESRGVWTWEAVPRRARFGPFVNYADRPEDGNLVAFRLKGRLYYRTVRDIPASKELLLCGGPSRGLRGVNLPLPPARPGTRRGTSTPTASTLTASTFPCKKCDLCFGTPLLLGQHRLRCSVELSRRRAGGGGSLVSGGPRIKEEQPLEEEWPQADYVVDVKEELLEVEELLQGEELQPVKEEPQQVEEDLPPMEEGLPQVMEELPLAKEKRREDEEGPNRQEELPLGNDVECEAEEGPRREEELPRGNKEICEAEEGSHRRDEELPRGKEKECEAEKGPHRREEELLRGNEKKCEAEEGPHRREEELPQGNEKKCEAEEGPHRREVELLQGKDKVCEAEPGTRRGEEVPRGDEKKCEAEEGPHRRDEELPQGKCKAGAGTRRGEEELPRGNEK
ncbi:hypothetical protein FOCC_FOCC008708, partial [Frankliniella occidentalis]